jgi:creatinine amidohydrolase
VIFNGHGGNTNPIAEALRQIRDDTGVKAYSLMVFPGEKGFGAKSLSVIKQESGGHACEMETSISLYLGERVLIDKAEKWKPPTKTPKLDRDWRGKINAAYYFDEITEIGSLGDPQAASAEKGRVLVDAVVEEISKFIEELKSG